MPLRRNSQPPRRVIEPIFPIPDGLEDLVYDEEPAEDELWFDVDEDDSDPTHKKHKKKKKKKHKKKKKKGKKKHKHKKKKGKKGKKKKDDDKGKKGTNTPKAFKIVKQILRTKADGSQTVDVVVEVDKVKAADKYEFRVTKRDTGKTTVITG
jgi:transposase